jgi:hypothetical protein
MQHGEQRVVSLCVVSGCAHAEPLSGGAGWGGEDAASSTRRGALGGQGGTQRRPAAAGARSGQGQGLRAWVGHTPLPFRMRRTLVPVTLRTCGMPSESRRSTPIWDGVRPFFDSLQILSQTSCDSDLHQLAFPRRYGMAEADIPFPLLCMRPMAGAASASGAAVASEAQRAAAVVSSPSRRRAGSGEN